MKNRKRTIINIEVDPELHFRLQMLCLKNKHRKRSGGSMKAIINQLIREYLEREEGRHNEL